MVPLKVINTSGRPVLLRCNAKLADLYPCIALEDIDSADAIKPPLVSCPMSLSNSWDQSTSLSEKLKSVGLHDLDVESCDVSDQCRQRLNSLIFQEITLIVGKPRASSIESASLTPDRSDFHSGG